RPPGRPALIQGLPRSMQRRNTGPMNHPCPPDGFSRRDFLASATGLSLAAAIQPSSLVAAEHASPSQKMIGIQIGSVSFVDEGVEAVLDNLQQKAAVNTIFLTTFTYGRGLAGRQIPGQPFPDHGPQESDEKFFHGGNYATPHPEFYRDTILKD